MTNAIYAADYGVSPSNANNLAALNDALDAANAADKACVLPPGTLVIDAASPVLNITDHTRIIGAGRGVTILQFNSLDGTTDAVTATGKTGIYIADLSLYTGTIRTNSNLAFAFFDCVDCTIERCGQTNFTQGFVFGKSTGSTPPTTTNLRNKAIACTSYASRSYGFFLDHATACEFIDCEAYGSTNQDGFKTGGGSTFCKIVGCHSEGHAQDGFDTYDGFICGVFDNNTAYENGNYGFQFKGTYAAGDYVGRESAFSNCVAKANGLGGFLLQEIRNCAATNLIAVENATAGFVLNNIQGWAFTGCVALRNGEHGWGMIGGTSRNAFAGCFALDNSYTDGTAQNGTFDGFNLNTAGVNTFVGCQSMNGTQAGKRGGQGYGYNTTTSTGNVFTGCVALSNVTGRAGGTNPYTNNAFSSMFSSSYWGLQVSSAGHWTPAISATYDVGSPSLLMRDGYFSRDIYLGSQRVTKCAGSPEGAVTAPVGSMALRSDGGAGSTLYVKEGGTGNTGWIAK